HLTQEAFMGSTTKVIGLVSCWFLLCLGLSTATPAGAADGTHEGQKDRPRVGGQSGQPDEGQALGVEGEKANTPHERQKGGPRVGGEAGQPDAAPAMGGEKGKPHERQPGGPRVGGEAGQP
ncbi:MAG: hypothetical protein ACREJN_02340, partial [Nitrospiraceae bacterium]